jgi:PAS domain S-box-containing protein
MTMVDEAASELRFARPLRALILEDDPVDAELIAATLRRAGYSLTVDLADSTALLRERLGAANYDTILADYNLGDWTAMDALKLLQELGKDIPLVVVTGTLGDEEAVDCIKRGAADYVLKQHLERVPLAVDGALQRKAYRDQVARQQEEIRRAKDEWELTFDTVPDPILLLDEQFRIKHANRATVTLLGLEAAELAGKHCYEVLHGSAEPHPDCPYQRSFATGKEERVDIEERRLGRSFEASAAPFIDSGGAMRGCVHVLRDITMRKLAEESLRQLSAQVLRAQDDERRQIARELHDSFGQNLAALDLNLESIKQSASNLDARTRGVLAESLELVKRCAQEIRDFSYLLHPPMLDDYGLASALRWYVQGFARRTGIEVFVDIPDDLPRLPLGVETALFRLVQECLTNVHRHSGSPSVSIRMVQESNRFSVEVRDQGRGMATAAPGPGARRPGVGVLGMRERMREKGGTFEIESNSQGTIVRASVPVLEAAA